MEHAKILVLAHELRNLILSFENSPFYRISKGKTGNVRVLTLKQSPVLFCVGVKIDSNNNCAVTWVEGRCASAVSANVYGTFYVHSDAMLNVPRDFETNFEPLNAYKLCWNADYQLVEMVFREAIEVVKAAQELEKEERYFIGNWIPRAFSKMFLVPFGTKLRAMTYEEAFERYSAECNSILRSEMNQLTNTEFRAICEKFLDIEFPPFPKNAIRYPSMTHADKTVKEAIQKIVKASKN